MNKTFFYVCKDGWMDGWYSVNVNRWREESLLQTPNWIARECVAFSIPSFFWWEWNVKWQNPRQSPVCVSKARLIQDEFWACQAQLYQPRLTLTELKKENMKRKEWHDEMMSCESMCELSFVKFLFWWNVYRLQAKTIMNKPAVAGELMLWTHQHCFFLQNYMTTKVT